MRIFSAIFGIISIVYFATENMDNAIFYMALAIWVEPKGDK
ncbi:hypothetical protein [Desulfosporosinus nitroreducens]|nr:hypothetical protein [Desulfosporosinus nitroreducens]